jgi:predicted nucleic acid-binding protein
MKLPDSIIAGTAISLKLPFVTSDKQFKTVNGLSVIYSEK